MDFFTQWMNDFKKLRESDISVIWEITEQNAFVLAMDGWVCRKSNYGKNMAALTPAEQVFYICQTLDGEVNNGGFSQYLYNSSGNHANRVADCMDAIGANKTAEICRKAMAAFAQPLPEDRDEREEFLDEFLTDDVSDILEECDSEFYDEGDNLEQLSYSYIQAHKNQFT